LTRELKAQNKLVDKVKDLAEDDYLTLHEAALYIVYHPCRVPLVFRVEAVHLLLESGWTPITTYMKRHTTSHIFEEYLDSNKQAEIWMNHSKDVPKVDLLILAWKWCHQLETTALMVRLIHRTQQLWNAVLGDLNLLPNIDYAPPLEGYAVKDVRKCR
jgi:hypothetical protein